MKLLFASNNKGKQIEVKDLLAGIDIEVIFPSDLGIDIDVDETGETFQDNALLKAKAFAQQTNLLTAADDSGLCLDAFDGFPGVKTNRWMEGDARDKNLGIIAKLENEQNRSAQFVTSICLYDPKSDKTRFFQGEVRGQISKELAGDDGFGYDPVFIPEGYQTTFAQMGTAEKNKFSHRFKALEKLKEYLISISSSL